MCDTNNIDIKIDIQVIRQIFRGLNTCKGRSITNVMGEGGGGGESKKKSCKVE